MAEADATTATSWARRSPWADIAAAGRFGRPSGPAGLTIRRVDGGQRFELAATPHRLDELSQSIETAFDTPLVNAPRASAGRRATFLGVGPHRWWVVSPDDDLGRRLVDAVGPLGSVVDQSSARAVLEVEGPDVQAFLRKGVLVDTHASAFGPDDVAMTMIGHLPATLRRLGDGFEITVARSMAASLWHWVAASAGEFGYEVV